MSYNTVIPPGKKGVQAFPVLTFTRIYFLFSAGVHGII